MVQRVLVAGYGNRLREDDGAGWLVAEAIGSRWGKHVHVLTGQQLVPEWAGALAAVDVAYLVDAEPATSEGQVLVTQLRPTAYDLHGDPSLLFHPHALGPEQLLALAETLYGGTAQTYLVSVPAVRFGFGETLSPVTRKAVQLAEELLDRLLSARLAADQETVSCA